MTLFRSARPTSLFHSASFAPRPRIVSLIASATEIVDALGFGEDLVGRSHECDYPPQVASLPMCSSPKIDVHGTSREIDERVKDVLRSAASVYNVDTARLDELAPTVIITQTQCEVCAVSLKDVEQAMSQMISSRPKIVACSPNSLEDVWADFRRVAESLEKPEAGEKLVTESRMRLDQLAQLARREETVPTIACIEWIDPLMAAGNWVPELVGICGGQNLFGVAGQHSPGMTFEDLVAADPDVIAVMPCGFDLPRVRQEISVLTSRPEFSRLKAVQNGRAFLADGNWYFNRPGPRLVNSAEILVEMLHPDVCDFGYRGKAYEAL